MAEAAKKGPPSTHLMSSSVVYGDRSGSFGGLRNSLRGSTESAEQRAIEAEDNEFFMSMAAIVAKRSKLDDKVGAVIVNTKHLIVGYGYNGTPLGHDTPGPIVVDAQTNAILFAVAPLEGSTMYTTQAPNSAAAAAHIVQAQIKEVKYLRRQGSPDMPEDVRKILGGRVHNVLHTEVRLEIPQITINFADFGRVGPPEARGQAHD